MCIQGFVGGDLREREHLKDIVIYGRKLLKQIFKLWDGEEWVGLIWVRIGTGGRRMRRRNELSTFMKFEKFLD